MNITSDRRFFATPELVLMLCDNILLRRDLISVMRTSKTCYATLLPIIWSTLYGVQNLLGLLCDDSQLDYIQDEDNITYEA